MKLFHSFLAAFVFTLMLFGLATAIIVTIGFLLNHPFLLFSLMFFMIVVVITVLLYNAPDLK